jgi:hypothetical protein
MTLIAVKKRMRTLDLDMRIPELLLGLENELWYNRSICFLYSFDALLTTI